MDDWNTEILGDDYTILGVRRNDNQELLIVVPTDSGLSEATAIWRDSGRVETIGQVDIEYKKDVLDKLGELSEGRYEIEGCEQDIHHAYF